MNIVLAQLKKDFHCQWRPLLLWFICLLMGAIPYVITVVLNHADTKNLDLLHLTDSQKFATAISYVVVLMACVSAAMFGMFLMLPILVTRVIHEDPLMGTTAFWQTRPIPRSKLLLAKALFIVIILLPLLLALTKGGKINQDQFWPAMLSVVAGIAAVASITPSTSAWLGYGLSLFFGKQIFSGIIDRLWNHYHGPAPILSDEALRPLTALAAALHFNANDFYHLFYLVGFSAVFAHQYLTLRTKRSLALMIATLVAVAVLQTLVGPTADTPQSLK